MKLLSVLDDPSVVALKHPISINQNVSEKDYTNFNSWTSAILVFTSKII